MACIRNMWTTPASGRLGPPPLPVGYACCQVHVAMWQRPPSLDPGHFVVGGSASLNGSYSKVYINLYNHLVWAPFFFHPPSLVF